MAETSLTITNRGNGTYFTLLLLISLIVSKWNFIYADIETSNYPFRASKMIKIKEEIGPDSKNFPATLMGQSRESPQLTVSRKKRSRAFPLVLLPGAEPLELCVQLS